MPRRPLPDPRRSRGCLLALSGAVLATVLAGPARAQDGGTDAGGTPAGDTCRILEIRFQPAADDLQIAAWLEDEKDGRFRDTLFITRAVGTFGIGNRPGRFDLKSGFRWPYGRRTNALPVWAHAHGKTYPLLVFGDSGDSLAREGSVAYHEPDSTPEAYFCRPTRPVEEFCLRDSPSAPCMSARYPLTSSQAELAPPFPEGVTVDAITCPSVATLSKGRFDPGGRTTVYPPRNDLASFMDRDHPDTREYAELNELDAVSRATPPAGRVHTVRVPLVRIPDGRYRLRVEVNREFDRNLYHAYPAHLDDEVIWSDYGAEHLGQPSVIYELPIEVASGATRTGSTLDYVGYGAWDGADGEVRPPDETITTDVPGSGAGRLAPMPLGEGKQARIIATTVAGESQGAPGPVEDLTVESTESGTVTLALRVPEDGPPIGDFDVRYRAGQPIDDGTFESATPVAQVPLGTPGQTVRVRVGGLKPQTRYYFGVRSRGLCGEPSAIRYIDVETPRTPYATLEGCFVATAAYGSDLAPEVSTLRAVRDRWLRRSPLGRRLIATYYAASPPLARIIARDPGLRRAARSLLVPFVTTAQLLGARP